MYDVRVEAAAKELPRVGEIRRMPTAVHKAYYYVEDEKDFRPSLVAFVRPAASTVVEGTRRPPKNFDRWTRDQKRRVMILGKGEVGAKDDTYYNFSGHPRQQYGHVADIPNPTVLSMKCWGCLTPERHPEIAEALKAYCEVFEHPHPRERGPEYTEEP